MRTSGLPYCTFSPGTQGITAPPPQKRREHLRGCWTAGINSVLKKQPARGHTHKIPWLTPESPFQPRQLVLPTGELVSPWQPSFCQGRNGRMPFRQPRWTADALVRKMHPFRLPMAVSTLRNWHGKRRQAAPLMWRWHSLLYFSPSLPKSSFAAKKEFLFNCQEGSAQQTQAAFQPGAAA